MWITNGSVADIAIVWARVEGGHHRLRRACGHTRVFGARDMTHKLSLRASVTSELHLDDVRLPDGRPDCPTRRACRVR